MTSLARRSAPRSVHFRAVLGKQRQQPFHPYDRHTCTQRCTRIASSLTPMITDSLPVFLSHQPPLPRHAITTQDMFPRHHYPIARYHCPHAYTPHAHQADATAPSFFGSCSNNICERERDYTAIDTPWHQNRPNDFARLTLQEVSAKHENEQIWQWLTSTPAPSPSPFFGVPRHPHGLPVGRQPTRLRRGQVVIVNSQILLQPEQRTRMSIIR